MADNDAKAKADAEKAAAEKRMAEQEPTARPAAAVVAEGGARIDETIPGGMFIDERGRRVNANGQEIDAKGKVKKADD